MHSHEHRRHDVVAAARVGEQFVEQIASAGMVPEMMVRIADGQLGLENFFHGRSAHGDPGRSPVWIEALPRFQTTDCLIRAIRQPGAVRTSVCV